jgi:hypothetical protein
MAVNVGDEVAGNLYQVHICSPISIKRIQNKKGCFMIDQCEGLPHLVIRMNEFKEKIKVIDNSSEEEINEFT